MQLQQITPGKWYQTKKGDGLCEEVGHRGAKMRLADGSTVWCKANEVQYQIAMGQEPKQGDVPEEPLKPDKKRTKGNELERCKALCELLVKGLRVAVYHLENQDDPITPDVMDDLRETLRKAEGDQ